MMIFCVQNYAFLYNFLLRSTQDENRLQATAKTPNCNAYDVVGFFITSCEEVSVPSNPLFFAYINRANM